MKQCRKRGSYRSHSCRCSEVASLGRSVNGVVDGVRPHLQPELRLDVGAGVTGVLLAIRPQDHKPIETPLDLLVDLGCEKPT